MAVAEMPGDPHQVLRIVAANLDQRLGCRYHLDQAAIVEHQRVAAAQRHGVFEIEQELKPARSGHRHPPPVPVVEIEHDGIGRRFLPVMLALDSGGADHRYSFSILPSLMISITVGDTFSGAEYSRQTFMCGALPWALRSSRVSQRSTTTNRLRSLMLVWLS